LIFNYIRLAYNDVLQESKNRLPLLCYTHEILRCAIIICLIIAAARPQLSQGPQKIKSEGLDMMLVLDTSTSMLAKDLKTSQGQANRLQVAKGVLNEFIQQRKDDRLGITIFGAQAYAYTPLTIDHQVLLQYLEEVEVGMAGEATALGDAIGVATNRLKEVKSHNPIMILLTDGENTAGSLSPLQAAEAAKALRIRIYTVGVGSNGLVPFPTPMGDRPVQIRLDEKTLRMIAKSTGGRYFRATDAASLAKIYDMIDKLEKTEQESEYYIQKEELFAPWVWGALLLLLLELLFQFSIWKPIP
ncbi:MAG: VWA domain-containing protein, partial [Zetaproteobacteria bacterium]|nr:VWA domain-containing protein [Zetaproteobacteria bacterium]